MRFCDIKSLESCVYSLDFVAFLIFNTHVPPGVMNFWSEPSLVFFINTNLPPLCFPPFNFSLMFMPSWTHHRISVHSHVTGASCQWRRVSQRFTPSGQATINSGTLHVLCAVTAVSYWWTWSIFGRRISCTVAGIMEIAKSLGVQVAMRWVEAK